MREVCYTLTKDRRLHAAGQSNHTSGLCGQSEGVQSSHKSTTEGQYLPKHHRSLTYSLQLSCSSTTEFQHLKQYHTFPHLFPFAIDLSYGQKDYEVLVGEGERSLVEISVFVGWHKGVFCSSKKKEKYSWWIYFFTTFFLYSSCWKSRCLNHIQKHNMSCLVLPYVHHSIKCD